MQDSESDPLPSTWGSIAWHVVRQAGRAARANLLPGAVIQVMTLGVVLGYYFAEPVRLWCDQLALWKEQAGYGGAMLTTALAGGVVPAVVLALWRRQGTWLAAMYFSAFWAIKGAEVNLLYEIQAMIFGAGTEIHTIIAKVLVDQWCTLPLWAVPTMSLAYFVAEQQFSWSRTRAAMSRRWLLDVVAPMLVANQAVWVPAVALIYCLPTSLQLPVQNLVLLFWTLLLAFLTDQAAGQ